MTFKELFCGPSDGAPESVTVVNFSKLTDTQLIMVALAELLGWCPEPNEELIDELKRRIKEETKSHLTNPPE